MDKRLLIAVIFLGLIVTLGPPVVSELQDRAIEEQAKQGAPTSAPYGQPEDGRRDNQSNTTSDQSSTSPSSDRGSSGLPAAINDVCSRTENGAVVCEQKTYSTGLEGGGDWKGDIQFTKYSVAVAKTTADQVVLYLEFFGQSDWPQIPDSGWIEESRGPLHAGLGDHIEVNTPSKEKDEQNLLREAVLVLKKKDSRTELDEPVHFVFAEIGGEASLRVKIGLGVAKQALNLLKSDLVDTSTNPDSTARDPEPQDVRSMWSHDHENPVNRIPTELSDDCSIEYSEGAEVIKCGQERHYMGPMTVGDWDPELGGYSVAAAKTEGQVYLYLRLYDGSHRLRWPSLTAAEVAGVRVNTEYESVARIETERTNEQDLRRRVIVFLDRSHREALDAHHTSVTFLDRGGDPLLEAPVDSAIAEQAALLLEE